MTGLGSTMMGDVFESFAVSIRVLIRRCREEDLPTLEWFGLFAPHRELIGATYAAQLRGEAIMLVAEANGVASGQAWIDLAARQPRRVGTIWAVRVFPCLQNLGIGTRLVRACEEELCRAGFEEARLAVSQHNPGARRLYERLGYEFLGPADGRDPQWLFRRFLPCSAASAGHQHPQRSGSTKPCP